MKTLFSYKQARTNGIKKQDLIAATSAANLTPRPNWKHPSHREFCERLKVACDKLGMEVTAERHIPKNGTTKRLYQTKKSWIISHKNSDTAMLVWDTEEGEMHGKFSGSHWKPLVKLLPSIQAEAYEYASIGPGNIHEQVSLMLMDNFPIAPYIVSSPRRSYVLAHPGAEDQLRTFYSHIGWDIGDALLLSLPEDAALLKVAKSEQVGIHRLKRTGGWIEICRRSHQELARYINGV